ncbi:MAG: D-alanyl-D-alanine carboxypeptidase [Lachnospiraceae bacterium]|nr:D-alanyl-D-alanine carboxypeptidase [Lachnospiraceae bacterium]
MLLGNSIRRRWISIFAAAILTLLMIFETGVLTHADTMIPDNLQMTVDGERSGTVRAINASYLNNCYISLRDAAVLLSGTSCQFNVDITGGTIAIKTGEGYSDEYSHSGFSEEALSQYSGADPATNPLTVNEEEKRYFTMLVNLGDHFDCFISPMVLAMILDVGFDMDENGIIVNTSEGFNINPAKMESYGFFDGVNSVIAGDATTGEIFYGHNPDEAQPIASTTKLMTYLLTMDAVSAGKITLDDKVTISAEAARLSATQDGTVPLAQGWEIPVSELILGALLPSSNECALSLAEYVGGSEEEFVNMMNDKAKELSMTTAEFYNSNGLPIYTDTIIPAKKQNKMSGRDMFKLCSHIVNTYPQVKEITSLKRARMETLNKELKNTNGLLYNLSEVSGLKTGTTDKSRACLVTSVSVQAGDGMHDLIVVTLGAENSQSRLEVSELMARYAMNVINGRAAKVSYALNGEEEETDNKITAESIIKMVVDHALDSK